MRDLDETPGWIVPSLGSVAKEIGAKIAADLNSGRFFNANIVLTKFRR
jgi:hypothetical protein